MTRIVLLSSDLRANQRTESERHRRRNANGERNCNTERGQFTMPGSPSLQNSQQCKIMGAFRPSHFGSSHFGSSFWISNGALLARVPRFGSFCDLLHLCKTARHAPQRMVSVADASWLVPGSSWPSFPGRAVASLATVGVVEAVWGSVRCPCTEATASSCSTQMATWTEERARSGSSQKAAQHQLERLESALAALGETFSAEARSLNAAVKEARRAAQGRPVAVQITIRTR